VNAQVGTPPLFVAAYILWRICWIHPFDDGGGRTARAVSYLVLSQRLGMVLPGEHPIPQRIKAGRIAYHRALEAADVAWARGQLDVSEMIGDSLAGCCRSHGREKGLPVSFAKLLRVW
jgi:Fic family protein